ncbi:hypothetical protein BaRGS_00029039 [Batillaria attramentaria]|uniref:Uncharacterized protein n=1 Tax=Batillaria attramentaria TaxID=370345 RepID=A0ABD0JXN2_9CAEN
MSVKETVGRYEGPPRVKSDCFKAQLQRIQDDEMQAAKLRAADMATDINEKAKWAEKLETKVAYKRVAITLKQCKAETRQAAKASIMVRRRALELLLQKDTAGYAEELAALGKTFHKQRV